MITKNINYIFIKSVFLTVVILTLFCENYSFSTQLPDSLKTKKSEMKMDKNRMMNMKEDESADTSIIRKGVIDLKAIDKNKDGKVFQCPMDYNIISDKPGIDPQCGMKLKEVTLAKAKKNLIGAGYKVK